MHARLLSVALAAAVAASAGAQTPSPSASPQAGPKRKRVVTDLKGFDLLDPRTQTTVVGAARGLLRPEAAAPHLARGLAVRPTFTWTYKGKARDFAFVLRNDRDEELFRTNVNGLSLRYPADAPPLVPERTYFWTVETTAGMLSGPSTPVGLLIVGSDQRAAIEKELARAASGDGAESALARARVLTDRRVWYDSLAAYSDLVARYPERADLFEARGTIYAQVEATRALADADFEKADALRGQK